MSTPWERFKQAARLEEPDSVPVALIVDSPWLPGYAGIDTLDFFLDADKWYEIHRGLLDRFPDAVWIPGFWVEYGMAAEPTAFGARVHFHHDSPPSIEPVVTDTAHWANAPLPNVQEDGFMPLVLRLTKHAEERLQAEGLSIKMVAARGPMVTASWVMGVTNLMTGIATHPKEISKFLDTVTTTIINWLHAQLEVITDPEGIMLLDDIVGMVSVEHYEAFIAPRLRRIFDEFEGLIRIYHNDTPCAHLYPALAEANFDVFNFTHEVDIAQVKAMMGHRVALMGNVPPLDVGVRESPEVVAQWSKTCLDRAAPGGGMILSVGGGVSPGMPAENIDAMLQAARAWIKPTPDQIEAIRQEVAVASSGVGRTDRRSRRKRRR
ncbi:MAG: uroporphyrinogen decarboxylase [Chloroflexi bacterium]|jgi:uroporphyrinogen decarboxylase|nr:uroporphyrinogen decarboxylase [Chloroflexota bacterium]